MIALNRFKFTDYGTFGKLFDWNGKQLCYTLERMPTSDHPCISPGTYAFNAYVSPTKGDVWLRDDAAANDGRTMIEIHPANLASQLRGCIAVGDAIGSLNGIPAVLNSQDTFEMLKETLPQSFDLTITQTT